MAAKGKDDTGGDSTRMLTKGLVEGHEHTKQRTRVMSGPELDYLQYLHFLASPEGLGEPMYDTIAQTHEELMIAYEGKSREEFVLGLSRIFERQYGQDLGYQYQAIAEEMETMTRKGPRDARNR